MLRVVLVVPFTVVLVARASAQQTILVPQNQPTIEAAIAAAADGDRIQLTQSSYTIGYVGLTLGKSVTIETVGVARATITLPDSNANNWYQPAFPALTITGFGAGNKIALRNLTFAGGASQYGGGSQRSAVIDVQLANAAGEIVLEGVEAIGELRHSNDACPGLRLAAGANVRVMLRNCRFEGATGQSPWFASNEIEFHGSAGAIVNANGPFVAEACTFAGGAGGRVSWGPFGPWHLGRDGGAGLLLTAPIGVVARCMLDEGIPGAAFAFNTVGAPNPCTMYGASGASVVNADVYDCTRVFTLPGCNQPPQAVTLNAGRADIEPIAPASVGVPFPISIRPLPASSGLSLWVFGFGIDGLALPGIAGRLYVSNAFIVGIVPPPGPSGWSTITFPPPPAALPWLPTFAVQPLHLDNALTLQFGAVSTFTVLVP